MDAYQAIPDSFMEVVCGWYFFESNR